MDLTISESPKILQALNSDLLLQAKCYFAGGTAIVLSLAEYRESIDVIFSVRQMQAIAYCATQ